MSFLRSVIITVFWRPEVARIGSFSRHFCVFYGKTTPYDKIFKILFGKFITRHRSTLLCANFVKIVRREIGEIVRTLGDQKSKVRIPLKLSLLRGSRPKSAMASPQHGSQRSKFHSAGRPTDLTFSNNAGECWL